MFLFPLVILGIICLVLIVINIVKYHIYFHPNKEDIRPLAMNQKGGAKNLHSTNISLKKETDTLHGWLFMQNEDYPTILFSHGNAGNISHRGEIIQTLCDLGTNVCIYDYHGYGHSTGRPSEANFYKAGEVFTEYLLNDLQIPLSNIIFMGESIGCCVATYLAQKYQSPKLILLSGFSSIKDLFYHFVVKSVSFLRFFSIFVNDFPTDKYLDQYHGQTLILHSKTDGLIPYEQAEANAKHTGCRLIEIEGTHNQPIFNKHTLNTMKKFMNL
jgi:uncharacterized protein